MEFTKYEQSLDQEIIISQKIYPTKKTFERKVTKDTFRNPKQGRPKRIPITSGKLISPEARTRRNLAGYVKLVGEVKKDFLEYCSHRHKESLYKMVIELKKLQNDARPLHHSNWIAQYSKRSTVPNKIYILPLS